MKKTTKEILDSFEEKPICKQEVIRNIGLAEQGLPLTQPLARLNTHCNFKEVWESMFEKERKEELKARQAAYKQKPSYIAWRKAYCTSQKYKARIKEYNKRPEVKARKIKYLHRPEVRNRINAASRKKYWLNKQKEVKHGR